MEPSRQTCPVTVHPTRWGVGPRSYDVSETGGAICFDRKHTTYVFVHYEYKVLLYHLAYHSHVTTYVYQFVALRV